MLRPSFVLLSAVAACFTAMPARAAFMDPATEFSIATNPNGVWTYGYMTMLGGAFTPHSQSGTTGSLDYWRTDLGAGVPWVAHNTSATAVGVGSTGVVEGGALTLHPGLSAELSVIRFTPFAAGSFRFTGAFVGQDIGPGTSTDVHLLSAGSSLFDAAVVGYGPASAMNFDVTISLAAGVPVDFAVGAGPQGNANFDSTGLSGQVESVPEPSAAVLLLLSATMTLSRRRRMQKSGEA